MVWLGKRLGFNEMCDWYNIRCDHFYNNKGRSLLMQFGSSPSKVVTNVSFYVTVFLRTIFHYILVFNEHMWEHFRFHRLPKNSGSIKQEAKSIFKSVEPALSILLYFLCLINYDI